MNWLTASIANLAMTEDESILYNTHLPFHIHVSDNQAVNWFLYSHITPIIWVRIIYSEKPIHVFPIFSFIVNLNIPWKLQSDCSNESVFLWARNYLLFTKLVIRQYFMGANLCVSNKLKIKFENKLYICIKYMYFCQPNAFLK